MVSIFGLGVMGEVVGFWEGFSLGLIVIFGWCGDIGYGGGGGTRRLGLCVLVIFGFLVFKAVDICGRVSRVLTRLESGRGSGLESSVGFFILEIGDGK